MHLCGTVQWVVMGGKVWLSSWLSDHVVWVVVEYVAILVVALKVVAVAEGAAEREVVDMAAPKRPSPPLRNSNSTTTRRKKSRLQNIKIRKRRPSRHAAKV